MTNQFKTKFSNFISKCSGLFKLIIILCMISGCTHTREITMENQVDNFNEINNYDGGKIMTIYLINGTKFETNLLTVTNDSTYFMRGDIKKLTAIKTSDIIKLNQKYGGRGAVVGLVLGVTFGIITGAIIGSVIPVNNREIHTLEDLRRNLAQPAQPLVNVGTGILIGGSLGGILGLLVGSTNGNTNSYIFKDNIELGQKKFRNQKK